MEKEGNEGKRGGDSGLKEKLSPEEERIVEDTKQMESLT